MGRLVNMFSLALCLLLPASPLCAQGGTAMPFIRIERDPVKSGMGYAGAASTANTAYSSFRNSAAIPLSDKAMDLGFSYQGWAPDGTGSTNLNFGGAYKVGKRLGFSVGGALQGGESYTVHDAGGNPAGTFKPKDMVVNGGLGARLSDGLSAGVNARYASQELSDDDSYAAFCADIFLLYKIGDANLAAGLSSIGSPVKDASGEKFALPASATAAVGYSKAFPGSHALVLAADADYFFKGGFTLAVGAGYSFKDMLFLRTGYHLATKQAILPSFLTVGAGFKLGGASLDLSYLTANGQIGNTVTLGLGYSF